MKKLKVSILALSVLVGGAVLASAAATATIMSTSDVTLTNGPAPLIWSSVSDLPTSALFNPNQGFSVGAMTVDTDNGGKIAGVANIQKKYFGSADTNAVTAISSWYTTVKGSIKATAMGKPSVQMSLKGDGYLAPGTNTTIIKPGEAANGFPGKFSLNFTAKDTAAISNNLAWHIVGNLKGTITPPTKGAKPEKVDQAADLIVDRISMDTISLRVIVFGSKFAAILHGTDATGTGTFKNGAYKLNLKPVAGGSSSLLLDGQITAVTQAPFTNITTINTANIKGKIQGQAVQSTGFKFGSLF